MTENTIEIPAEITCVAAARSGYRPIPCRKPAVQVLQSRAPGGDRFEPLCGQHVGAEKRKKWGYGTLVEFTPEIIAKLVSGKAEAKKANEERKAVERAESAKRHAAYVERRAEEAKRQFTVVRKDEDARWGEDKGNPKWYVHQLDLPVEHVGRSFGENSAEVERYDDMPTTIRLRASSDLDIAEAEALVDALKAAIAEAQR